MNKLFAVALIAGAAQALDVHLHANALPVTQEELLDLAHQEDVQFDDGTDHLIIGPDFRPPRLSLAQTEQTAFVCNSNFSRFYPENQVNVDSILAGTTAFVDSTYTQADAMRNWTGTYTWRKMSVHFPASSGYKIFQNDLEASINIDDTIQGMLGDCWVLSAFAACAEKPSRVWKMFDTKTYNTAGIYSLRFYDMGVPISVVMDDWLPTYSSGTQHIFTNVNTQKELWPILIEKAFSKIHGNYYAIEGGWMIDAGNTFMGTGGEGLSTSSLTVQQIWDYANAWDAKQHIMTCATSVDLNGIIGGHAYTFIAPYTLNNGAQVFKIRNPWGQSEWIGAYADSDPFWTANPTEAARVGFINKNDGTFFMTATDFKAHFTNISYNYDSSNWQLAYWMARGDGHTVGVTGTSSYCGAACKRTTFDVTSPVTQTIYVSTYVHKQRQYVQTPCTDAATSKFSPYRYHYAAVNGSARIWNHGPNYFTPITITAGTTVPIITEIDWSRDYIEKDFSVSIWGEQAAVTITEKATNKPSAHWFVYNAGSTPTPPPNPTPEVCSASVNVTQADANRKTLLLSNGCNTRNATINITMEATQYALAEQTSSAHASSVCTTSGTSRTCTYNVAAGGADKLATILFGASWNGLYTSSITLA